MNSITNKVNVPILKDIHSQTLPNIPVPNVPVAKIPQPMNQNQLQKINELEQQNPRSIQNTQENYKFENIYNRVKDIGRLVQLIRIERRGIIRGNDVWNLLSKILGETEINSDLVSELYNYELNTEVFDFIEKRINSIENLNLEVYPDYFLNNIVKLYNQTNPTEINMVSLMHIGLDIGQLEYLIYKYITKPALPCYVPKIYDENLFIKILFMVQNLGRIFKKLFVNELPQDKKFFPLLLVKYIQGLFEKMGSEIINQMSKYKINRDKIKLFFEVTMDDDLHDADEFNINAEDTLSERVYKVAYKYLRDDFTDGINDYILSVSYKIIFTMLDLYDYDKPHLPIDKLIELMFFSGAFLASISSDEVNGDQEENKVNQYNMTTQNTESKTTSFLDNMSGFDDLSISKLFNLQSYFENNDIIPNKKLMEMLDKFYAKINTEKFNISTTKIQVIPEHIKYLPIESTQLYCLIKPKNITNVDTIVQKINEAIFIFTNPTPQNIQDFYDMIKLNTNLDDVPVITSLITQENDLQILGIDDTYNDEQNDELNDEQNDVQNDEQDDNQNINMSDEEQSGGNFREFIQKKYRLKYLKYKKKYKCYKKN
jgi:hypothetical protein